MTKSQLIIQIAEEAKLPKGRAEAVVNAVFDAMIDAMRRDEGIEIRGFGSFTVRHYGAYKGRNPKTGDSVHVGPKRLPYFKVGKELRERINGEAPPEVATTSSAENSAENSTENPAKTRSARTQERATAEGRPRVPRSRDREESVSEDVI